MDPLARLNPEAVRAAAGEGALSALFRRVGPRPVVPAPGAVLAGRYEFVRVVGGGGMGQVFEVRDRVLERPLAMKVLLPNWIGDANEKRFVREGRLAADLRHPHVLPVYDCGSLDDGRPYYTTVLLPTEGRLTDRLADRPAADFPAWRLARLREFLSVCEAMAHAHSRGVIHRDLKPHNVMVSEYGELFVLDWGVGRRLTEAEDLVAATPPEAAAEPGLTGHGDALGTREYMAPEQSGGPAATVGKPADVFALGRILGDILAVRSASGHLPPPALAALAAECRQLEPEKRPSVADVAARLRAYFESVERAERERLRRRWRVAAAAVAAVLLVTAVGFAVYYRVAEQETGELAEKNRIEAAKNKTLAESEAAARVDADRNRAAAEVARQVAEAAERSARSRAAALAFERGTALADGSKPVEGLPWLVRALELAPAGDPIREPAAHGIAHWLQRSPRLQAVIPHDKVPYGLAFHPKKERLYSAGKDGRLRGWDASTGAAVGQPVELPASVERLLFAADGATLYAPCADGNLYRFSAEGDDLCPMPTWEGHGDAILAVALSPDGRHIATGGKDGFLLVRDTADGEVVVKTRPHGRRTNGVVRAESRVIRDAAFSPDGQRIATAGWDGSIRVSDWRTLKNEQILDHEGPLPWAVCFLPVGRRTFVVSADFGGHVYSWDAQGNRQPTGLKVHGQVTRLVPRPGPFRADVLVAGYDQAARIWTGNTQRMTAELTHPMPVEGAVWSADGFRLATACPDGVRIWHLPVPGTRDELRTDEVDAAERVVEGGHALAPTGDRVARTELGGTGRVWVWDVTPDGVKQIPGPPPQKVGLICAEFNADSRLLLLGGEDGSVRLWDLTDRKELWRVPSNGNGVRALAFAPRGGLYAAGDVAGGIRIGRADSGEVVRTAAVADTAPFAVRFTPDGKTLVVAALDRKGQAGLLTWWDTATGQEIGPRRLLPNVPLSVALAPDGRTVVVGSFDRRVSGWDMATHESVGPDIRLQAACSSVRFDASGRFLFTVGNDGAGQIWHWATGRPVGMSFQVGVQLGEVAFARNGRAVAVYGVGAVSQWPLPEGPGELTALRRQVGRATGYAVGSDDRLVPLSADEWNSSKPKSGRSWRTASPGTPRRTGRTAAPPPCERRTPSRRATDTRLISPPCRGCTSSAPGTCGRRSPGGPARRRRRTRPPPRSGPAAPGSCT